jgi:hypothetical protein
VFASLVLSGCAGLADGQHVDLSSYERGKFHYNAGQYGLAVKHFQSAVDRVPDSVEALNGLAATYDRLGRYDLASRYYGRALGADPDSTQTLNNIGYSYLLQERFDLALAYLRDAHSRDKQDPVVVANRKKAEIAFQEVDLKRAAEAARAETAAAPTVDLATVVETTPSAQIEVVAAMPARRPAPRRGRVKPWIERAAPKVQTLVTQPQMALVGMVEQAGVAPQLAGYRPKQPKASDLLPDPLTAPLVLDDQPSPALGELISPKVTAVRLHPVDSTGDAPSKPEAPQTAPTAGLVPHKVTIASLEPVGDQSREMALRSDAPDTSFMTGLVSPVNADRGVDPLDSFEDTPPRSDLADVSPAVAPEPLEITVASLDAVVPVAPIEDASQPLVAERVLPLIEVSNGTGRLNMAKRIRNQLESEGVVVRRLTNADAYTYMETTIYYREGWKDYAEDLARMLPAVIDIEGRDSQASDIRLELGGDLLDFDRGLYYAVRRFSGAHSS